LRFATMSSCSYYKSDLAWVHHVGYSHHVEQTEPGVVALLRERGLAPGASVLDIGCGSGLLARQLRAAGYAVRGVDASPAMIELARDYEPGAKFDVVRLPTGLHPGDTALCPRRMLWSLQGTSSTIWTRARRSRRH
jgi:SAM-dependent methyltransferase